MYNFWRWNTFMHCFLEYFQTTGFHILKIHLLFASLVQASFSDLFERSLSILNYLNRLEAQALYLDSVLYYQLKIREALLGWKLLNFLAMNKAGCVEFYVQVKMRNCNNFSSISNKVYHLMSRCSSSNKCNNMHP